jgi:hypothetical protein
MNRNIALGVMAGMVSVLLFSVVAVGSSFSVLLYLVAPLPILIVALGWRHTAGIAGAVTGMILAALWFSPFAALTFALVAGIPGWLFGYLLLLSRETENGTEWYPLGRFLLWIAALNALLTCFGILVIARDFDVFLTSFRSLVDILQQVDTGIFEGLSETQKSDAIERFSQLAAVLVPPLSTAMSVSIMTFLVWGAAKLVNTSGKLPRPWPDLSTTRMPRNAIAVIVLATLLAFTLSEFASLFSAVIAASLLMAFCLQGLAVIHAITRPLKTRLPILLALYALFLILPGWPVLGFGLVGMAHSWFGIGVNGQPPSKSETPLSSNL